jgi:hypothetical protein
LQNLEIIEQPVEPFTLTSVDVQSFGVAAAGNPVTVPLQWPYTLDTYFGNALVFHGTNLNGITSIVEDLHITPAFDLAPYSTITNTAIDLNGLYPDAGLGTMTFSKPAIPPLVMQVNAPAPPIAQNDSVSASTIALSWNDLPIDGVPFFANGSRVNYNLYVLPMDQQFAVPGVAEFFESRTGFSATYGVSATFPVNQGRWVSVSGITDSGIESAAQSPVKVAITNLAPTIQGLSDYDVEGNYTNVSAGIPNGQNGFFIDGLRLETPYILEFLTLGDAVIDTYDLANWAGGLTTFNTLTDYSVTYEFPTVGPYAGRSSISCVFNVAFGVYSTIRKVRLTNWTGSSTFNVTWL